MELFSQNLLAYTNIVCRTNLLQTAQAFRCQPVIARQETGYVEARTWKKHGTSSGAPAANGAETRLDGKTA